MTQNFFKKPKTVSVENLQNKYLRFGLTENPFPASPALNTDAEDRRINGNIFELAIRQNEFAQIKKEFLEHPQVDPNHRRLGYVMDTSYVGRGNGKSAFIVYLQEQINHDYCLDISNEQNKCFAIRVLPESGGRTKTFESFIDIIIETLFRSNHIDYALASLYFKAIESVYGDNKTTQITNNSENIIAVLNNAGLLNKQFDIDIIKIRSAVADMELIRQLPEGFPLKRYSYLYDNLVTKNTLIEHYHNLKKSKDKLDFLFNHLPLLFFAADFNGAYIFVDDFEKIADFQSAQLKRDFARELRECLFDGAYINAAKGFFNFILIVHAGLPRLVDEAWRESGLENRVPLQPTARSQHIIKFEKLTKDDAVLLIKRYLIEFRQNGFTVTDELHPFTYDAILKMVEMSEFNAAELLRRAHDLLSCAADNEGIEFIDANLVQKYEVGKDEDTSAPRGQETAPINLFDKP